MSVSSKFYEATSKFYKTTYAVGSTAGKGLKAAFNLACGRTALDKRGLDRRFDYGMIVMSEVLAIGGGVAAGVCLAPVVGGLAAVFGVAAFAVGAFGPAKIQSAYLIGKHESQKAKAQKAAPQ